MLPAVRRLEEKYANELVAIGVHSGKFIAERKTENIRTATRRLGIDHPVVNDHQFRTWRAFQVQAWPTIALISPDGNYIGQHAGEITFDMFDPIFEAVVEAYSQAGLLDRTSMHFTPDPAPPNASPLLFPGKVLADGPGNRLFISDTAHNRVLVADLTGDGTSATVINTIGAGDEGFAGGQLSEAKLNHPEGMALSGDTLYIADTENHSIRAADLAAGTLKTIAGTGQQGYSRAGGIGVSAELSSPWDLLERGGQLYIAMAGTHQIWRMDLQSAAMQPFAGSGREDIDDGPNLRATLAQPSGLTTDGQRLFFADSESSAVRASDFSPVDGYTQTLVGEGLFEFGDRDDKGRQARLQHCLGVAYHNGRVYIADTYNNKIKTLDLETRDCIAALGSGAPSDLYEPGGMAIWARDGQAAVYIADTNNHRVLRSAIDGEGKLLPAVPLNISFARDAARLLDDEAHVTG
jgi:DNA-binding beta-propeller fold protein YncE